MIDRVVFTPDASDDVATAYKWYEARASGLGEDFLRCVEACVLRIRRHSQASRVAVDDFRRALIRRFPYEIFYETSSTTIVVYAVFHCSQDPRKWRRRLSGD
jgi:plasmid stabilization system protein ParE